MFKNFGCVSFCLKKGKPFQVCSKSSSVRVKLFSSLIPCPTTSTSDLQSLHFTHGQASFACSHLCIILLLASFAIHLCHIPFYHLTHSRPFCKAFFENLVCPHSAKPQCQVVILWFLSWNLFAKFLAKCFGFLSIALFLGTMCSQRTPSSKNILEDLGDG